jgi:hypothetical protein
MPLPAKWPWKFSPNSGANKNESSASGEPNLSWPALGVSMKVAELAEKQECEDLKPSLVFMRPP